MDSDKKNDDFLDDEDMNLLPLDFPEDDEINENDSVAEDKTVEQPEGKKQSKKSESEVESTTDDKKIINENKSSEREKKDNIEENNIVTSKKVNSEPQQIQFSSSFLPGQILQEGRVRADLSIEQVALATKIKKAYIIALEQDDKENLPPKVYVAAYVKNLCKVYGVDPTQVLALMGEEAIKRRHKVSGEILHDIEKGKQVNLQEEVRVRKFFKIVAIVLLILAVTITIVIKFGFSKNVDSDNSQVPSDKGAPKLVEANNGENQKQPEITINSEDLEVFILKKTPFTMTQMELPK